MALTRPVPVSIEPKRPSPIVMETILALGAQPSISLEAWLPLAMEATWVPWDAEKKRKHKIAINFQSK